MMNAFITYSILCECIESVFGRAELALNCPSQRIVAGAEFSSIVEMIRAGSRDYRYTYYGIRVLDVTADGFTIHFDERIKEMWMLDGSFYDRGVAMNGIDWLEFRTVERIDL